MTKRAKRKLQMRMKRAFRQRSQAKRQLQRAISSYSKLQRKYRAA
ncbi:MAG TPA: hypothetical protein VFB95_13465 [Candidatus Cryosericum sp.]|nr:hypothetical protein [Candidatus Cryosericum sp.]